MSIQKPSRALLGGLIIGALAATTAGILLIRPASASSASSSKSTASSNAAGGDASSASSADFLDGGVVQGFAAQDGVHNLQVLVSAGVGVNSSAVITGTDAAGESCWTVVDAAGEGGGDFRCGFKPGQEAGEPASQQTLRAGCEVSGSAGSTADVGSCVGFAGANVASVDAKLVDGTSKALVIADGAFAYAASTHDELPTAFVAYDSTGQILGQQDISLTNG